MLQFKFLFLIYHERLIEQLIHCHRYVVVPMIQNVMMMQHVPYFLILYFDIIFLILLLLFPIYVLLFLLIFLLLFHFFVVLFHVFWHLYFHVLIYENWMIDQAVHFVDEFLLLLMNYRLLLGRWLLMIILAIKKK